MKNKKLLVSAMALGLAGLTTVGSTYAWFTVNGTVDVNGINVQVSSADSTIFVAAVAAGGETTGLHYAPEVNLSSFFTVAGGLKPVTTDDAVNFYSQDLTTNSYDSETGTGVKYGINFSNYKATGFAYEAPAQNAAATVGKGQLVAVDLYIATSKNATVYLQNNLVWSTPTVDEIEIEDNVADARDVARWSFAKDGATPTANDIYKLGDFNRSQSDVAKAAYLAAFLSEGEEESTSPAFNKFYGTKATAEIAVLEKGILVTKDTQNKNFRIDATFDEADYDFHKITIQFWFEGNDFDCRNSISQQAFGTSNFVLTTINPNG